MNNLNAIDACQHYFVNRDNADKRTNTRHDALGYQSFRKHAELAITKLENYLNDTSIRGLELTDPLTLLQEAKKLMIDSHAEIDFMDEKKLEEIIDLYIKTGIQVHSPGYMGRQFSGVIPLASVIDFISATVNQPASFYEAAQLPNVAERIMADELNQFIGWEPGHFTMVTTSGGSLASLTAILAARNDRFPHVWSEGMPALSGQPRPAIAISDDAHYSVSRAAGILGIGEEQIVRLPINRARQICIEKVRPTLNAAQKRGLEVFCLVASAGNTSIGAFDPIDELAEITQEKNIWFHVDGAHGASLLVADKHRHKLKGIEKADSFIWDAHKMMFVPAPCTLLFYKNKEKSYGAFHQEASYVFEKKPDIYTEFDSAEKNFECTKRPMIMALWVLWALYGKSVFADKIEYLCELTWQAYRTLQRQQDFTVLHKPEANILVFQYLPQNFNAIIFPDFQVAIRNRIKSEGTFFISKVDINNTGALRVVFMNHEADIRHFNMLLDEIRRAGQALLTQKLMGTR